MSNLTTEVVNKKTTGKIQDVVFAYVKLQDGSYKYQSKTEKEYTVDVVVDKATAKQFKKDYPKNSYKDFENEEFTAKFKIDPPFPKQDEQYVIKLKASAQLKSAYAKGGLQEGDLIPYEWPGRPKVFVPVEGGVEDVTMSVLVANGSKGDIAFTVNSNDFGTFPQLTGILVKELIEYEQGGASSSAFGAVVGGYKAGDGNTQQKAVAAKDDEAKPFVPEVVEEEEEIVSDIDEESLPF